MGIRTAVVTIEGIAPLSQSNFFSSEKRKDESHEEFEKRAWPERMHVNADGFVYVPGRAFKYAIDEAQKRRGTKTGKGGGKETFTKFFQAGVDVAGDLTLKTKASSVKPIPIMASARGQKGKDAGTRVRRLIPTIAKWGGVLEIIVLDDTIPADELEKTLDDAGLFVGVGQFRPENQGSNGRFVVKKVEWQDT